MKTHKNTTPPVLMVGVNWLGDSVMSMPAIQAWRCAHPETPLVLLVKPKMAEVWRLHPAVTEVLVYPESLAGLRDVSGLIRSSGFQQAYVLPHSIRATLPPFLAGIPERTGLPGHWRDWMLTTRVPPSMDPRCRHQAWEYVDLLGLTVTELEPPRIVPPEAAVETAHRLLPDGGSPWIALMPGAARGPAKRWPPAAFAETGKRLQSQCDARLVILGTGEERPLCTDVATEIGPDTLNLAGQLTLSELAGVLSLCQAAVTNDSGGMHWATTVWTPVVAVFGITDPTRTGPLGRHVILQDSHIQTRDIRRSSPEAQAALLRITPAQVVEAVESLLSSAAPA